jgi:hypothetical protein
MKSVQKHYSFISFLTISMIIFPIAIIAQNVLSPQEQKLMSDFENQARAYSKLREGLEEKMPKLPEKATAKEIDAHKLNFQKAVQAARANAKQGDIFLPGVSDIIRKIIIVEFQGPERAELRKKVFEAEVQGVPLRVNVPYPDSKEQIDMPPTLLLRLPQLPKQLRYRFVGTSFLLVDRENGLIVDYMTKAIP